MEYVVPTDGSKCLKMSGLEVFCFSSKDIGLFQFFTRCCILFSLESVRDTWNFHEFPDVY